MSTVPRADRHWRDVWLPEYGGWTAASFASDHVPSKGGTIIRCRMSVDIGLTPTTCPPPHPRPRAVDRHGGVCTVSGPVSHSVVTESREGPRHSRGGCQQACADGVFGSLPAGRRGCGRRGRADRGAGTGWAGHRGLSGVRRVVGAGARPSPADGGRRAGRRTAGGVASAGATLGVSHARLPADLPRAPDPAPTPPEDLPDHRNAKPPPAPSLKQSRTPLDSLSAEASHPPGIIRVGRSASGE